MRGVLPACWLAVACAHAGTPGEPAAARAARDPAALIAALHGVHPMATQEENDAENRRLDRVWKDLAAHKAQALPALTLRGPLLAAFLYGPFGLAGEDHLLALVEHSPAHTDRILGILAWTGSPRSVAAVERILARAPAAATFALGFEVLMRVGGPA